MTHIKRTGRFTFQVNHTCSPLSPVSIQWIWEGVGGSSPAAVLDLPVCASVSWFCAHIQHVGVVAPS